MTVTKQPLQYPQSTHYHESPPNWQTSTAVLTYTEADERQSTDFPSGVTTTYTYTVNGPIDTISTETSTQVSLGLWDYSYNAALNIEDITTLDGLTDYSYDGLDRLSIATYPAGNSLTNESYEYDRVGNREDPTDPGLYDYDGNNQISASPGLTYSFDVDGNMTSRSDGAVMTYDAANRLRSFVGLKSGDYQYEPTGRRVSKTIDGISTTWFLWDGTQLLAEYDGAGNRTKRYAYLDDDFSPTQMEDANDIYSIHYDQLQTPKLMTNSVQVIVWNNRMQSYGSSILNDDPDGDEIKVALNIRFPGQYEDTESGFYNNYFRDYDPSTGRYIESDPIGLRGGINVYQYAASNPIWFLDPLGLVCNTVSSITSPISQKSLIRSKVIDVNWTDGGNTTGPNIIPIPGEGAARAIIGEIISEIVLDGYWVKCNANKWLRIKDTFEVFFNKYILELCESCERGNYLNFRMEKANRSISEEFRWKKGGSTSFSFGIVAPSWGALKCAEWLNGLNRQ